MNEGGVQEVSVRTDGGDAESQYSGVWMNAIPKEGANTYNLQITALFANKDLSASNLTQQYINQGLTRGQRPQADVGLQSQRRRPARQGQAVVLRGVHRNNEIDEARRQQLLHTSVRSRGSTCPTRRGRRPTRRSIATTPAASRGRRRRATSSASATRRIGALRRSAASRRACRLKRPPTRRSTRTPSPTITWRVPVNSKLLLDSGFMS